MANVDIAAETLKVGNAMASVRIDQMILNLAKGIAWGQYDLDKVGVEITKMMGVPGMVSIGGEKLSMLEAGFVPSFYHFVDTILEYKMEVSIREETSTSLSYKESTSRSSETSTHAETQVKAKASVTAGGGFIPASATASMEMSAKAGYSNKSTSAYSRSIDASHSQKFNQDLSAMSSMRTKIVPIPPPDMLVERIKILIERLRQEAADDDAAQVLFTFDGDAATALADNLDNAAAAAKAGSAEADTGSNIKLIIAAFSESEKKIVLSEVSVELVTEKNRWTVKGNKTANDPESSVSYFIEKSDDKLKVYQGSQEDKKSLDELLLDKVGEKLLERLA